LSEEAVVTEDQSHDRGSSLARLAALLGIFGAAVLVALLMFGRDADYRVKAVFENAGQLVKGNQVRVGGRPLGMITDVALNPSAHAEVELTVEEGLTPLHDGTTATIRASSLSGIANRYVSLDPGPNSNAEVGDGGLILVDRTSAPVDIDQLFNTFDPRTRAGLQQFIQGQATQYNGRSAEAEKSLRYFSPALSATSRLTRELIVDDGVFERFVVDTSRTLGAITQRRDELSSLVQSTGTAAQAIGDENVALDRGLEVLPRTLRKANTTFVNLRTALDDLDVLVAESKPATRDLDLLFRELRPLVAASRPTIRDLRVLVRKPGKNNDLIDLTAKLPRLERLTSVVLPRANRFFDESNDEVDTLRAYSPDLASFLTKFGQTTSYYDANGHFARVQPIFSPFSYNPDSGDLSRVPDGQRLDSFETDKSRRCPGSATQRAPDGSNPFAVPGCDPSITPPSR